MKLSQIVMTLVSEDSTTDARDVIPKASSTQLHQQVMYVINLWGKQLDKNFLIYMLNKVLTNPGNTTFQYWKNRNHADM